MGGHRFEHLGGHDDRHARRPRLANDLLLDVGDLLQRDVDPEIAAGHHHRVDLGQDGRQIGHHFPTFELGDDGDVGGQRGQEVAHLDDVRDRAHE